MPIQSKDFTTISPSAKSLLFLKGYTSIPFARETAALLQGSEVFDLDFDKKDFWFWIRVMHFESRYFSINQLLGEINHPNILELSSGYSLRSLDLSLKDENIHYIDTDLPDVVSLKKNLLLTPELNKPRKGHLELLDLNALDNQQFAEIVSRFSGGSLTIVNEGLLMYLDALEKERLCSNIHASLKKRGGYWITADVYIRRSAETLSKIPKSKGEVEFLEQHQIEENKFESYEAARHFFNKQGFEIVREATLDYQTLSSFKNVVENLPPEMRNSRNPPPKIQSTWMLQAI